MADKEAPNTSDKSDKGAGSGVDQAKIDALTDKSGPRAGDFVKVGDKLYTAKEIELLEKTVVTSQGEGKKAQEAEKALRQHIAKVYGNPEAPDRASLKELLVAAGKTADEAAAMIEEELGPESDEDGAGKKKGTKDEPEKKTSQSDNWTGRAWLDEQFASAAQSAFDKTEVFKKIVDGVHRRDAGDSKDEAVLKEARENADIVQREIVSGIQARATRILQVRIGKEGREPFTKAPVVWFRDAMTQAAVEEAAIARRRYGDPNKLGISPASQTQDPVSTWLETNKDKAKLPRRDGKKTIGQEREEFADALAHAFLSGYSKTKAGV